MFDYGNFGDLGLVEYYLANLSYDDTFTIEMVSRFNSVMRSLGWDSPFDLSLGN